MIVSFTSMQKYRAVRATEHVLADDMLRDMLINP